MSLGDNRQIVGHTDITGLAQWMHILQGHIQLGEVLDGLYISRVLCAILIWTWLVSAIAIAII